MFSYLLYRVVQVPLVLLVVSLAVFAITRATPGDPVQIMLGMETSPGAAEAMRKEFNLDQPLPVQYLLWVKQVLQGDFGRSIRLNLPVTSLLRERLPVSLQLAAAAMVIALTVSIPLGIMAALRRGTWIDNVCTGFTVWGFALPNFALALILTYVFSIKLGWFPITGIGSSASATGGWWAHFSPFIVPAIALSIHPVAVL